MLRVFVTIGLVLALTASDAWCAALCGTRDGSASVETQPACHETGPGTAPRAVGHAPDDTADASGLVPSRGPGTPPGAPGEDGCAGCETGQPTVNPAPANVDVATQGSPAAPVPPVFRRASEPLRRPFARAPAPPEPRTSQDVLARTSTLLL